MVAGRHRGDEQAIGDLAVGQAVRDELEDLLLAVGETGDLRRDGPLGRHGVGPVQQRDRCPGPEHHRAEHIAGVRRRELGHLPIAGDRLCHCGGVGCLDTVATTSSILRDVSAAVGAEVTSLDDAVDWGRRDARAAEVFRVAGHALGLGIASVVNLFGPQCVVLTGEGVAALDLIREPMRAGFVEQAFIRGDG